MLASCATDILYTADLKDQCVGFHGIYVVVSLQIPNTLPHPTLPNMQENVALSRDGVWVVCCGLLKNDSPFTLDKKT